MWLVPTGRRSVPVKKNVVHFLIIEIEISVKIIEILKNDLYVCTYVVST